MPVIKRKHWYSLANCFIERKASFFLQKTSHFVLKDFVSVFDILSGNALSKPVRAESWLGSNSAVRLNFVGFVERLLI